MYAPIKDLGELPLKWEEAVYLAKVLNKYRATDGYYQVVFGRNMFSTSNEPEFTVTVVRWLANVANWHGGSRREELFTTADIQEAVGMLKLLVSNAYDDIRSRDCRVD